MSGNGANPQTRGAWSWPLQRKPYAEVWCARCVAVKPWQEDEQRQIVICPGCVHTVVSLDVLALHRARKHVQQTSIRTDTRGAHGKATLPHVSSTQSELNMETHRKPSETVHCSPALSVHNHGMKYIIPHSKLKLVLQLMLFAQWSPTTSQAHDAVKLISKTRPLERHQSH